MNEIQKRKAIIEAMAGKKKLGEGYTISCCIHVESMEFQEGGYESFMKRIKLTEEEMKVVGEVLLKE